MSKSASTATTARKRPHQTGFVFPSWGGARLGAGRKRTSPIERVEHRTRPAIASRHPVFVTLRMTRGLGSLRRRPAYRVVRDAIVESCRRFGLNLVHFAVMSNHIHLICEVDGAESLTRGLKGFGVRIARRLNSLWNRTGRVIDDRYHARALTTPREVRNALAYLLNNVRHHGQVFRGPDPCSSGVWFDGWARTFERDPWWFGTESSPLPRARTWLLGVGWRRHGLIDPTR